MRISASKVATRRVSISCTRCEIAPAAPMPASIHPSRAITSTGSVTSGQWAISYRSLMHSRAQQFGGADAHAVHPFGEHLGIDVLVGHGAVPVPIGDALQDAADPPAGERHVEIEITEIAPRALGIERGNLVPVQEARLDGGRADERF